MQRASMIASQKSVDLSASLRTTSRDRSVSFKRAMNALYRVSFANPSNKIAVADMKPTGSQHSWPLARQAP
jgi:hypothetical protein